MTPPPRIAFFGGTFDPVHLGHLEIAQKAQRALQLDKVIFTPCKQSPHKDARPNASDTERLTMLQLTLTDHPWTSVSTFELENPPPSYTWKTLSVLSQFYPKNSRFYLIIGLDQWESLPRWKHPEKIADMVEFIVVGRDGHPTPRPGYRTYFLKGNHPASASEIRNTLLQSDSAPWLHPKVLTSLRAKNPYRK